MRQQFEKNRYVSDPKVIDVLLLKGRQDYQETLNCWQQEPHILGILLEKRDRPQRSFLQKFYEGEFDNSRRSQIVVAVEYTLMDVGANVFFRRSGRRCRTGCQRPVILLDIHTFFISVVCQLCTDGLSIFCVGRYRRSATRRVDCREFLYISFSHPDDILAAPVVASGL